MDINDSPVTRLQFPFNATVCAIYATTFVWQKFDFIRNIATMLTSEPRLFSHRSAEYVFSLLSLVANNVLKRKRLNDKESTQDANRLWQPRTQSTSVFHFILFMCLLARTRRRENSEQMKLRCIAENVDRALANNAVQIEKEAKSDPLFEQHTRTPNTAPQVPFFFSFFFSLFAVEKYDSE